MRAWLKPKHLLRRAFPHDACGTAHVVGVWLDRDEAEDWARSEGRNIGWRWVVYGVNAHGALAKLLRRQDQLAAMAEQE